MSLYASLFSGVSGLAANSSAMGMISDNIGMTSIFWHPCQLQFLRPTCRLSRLPAAASRRAFRSVFLNKLCRRPIRRR